MYMLYVCIACLCASVSVCVCICLCVCISTIIPHSTRKKTMLYLILFFVIRHKISTESSMSIAIALHLLLYTSLQLTFEAPCPGIMHEQDRQLER